MTNPIAAYAEYQTAYTAWAAGFDVMNILSAPEAPQMSPAARAGELMQRGLVFALRQIAHIALERELTEYEKQVATILIVCDE